MPATKAKKAHPTQTAAQAKAPQLNTNMYEAAQEAGTYRYAIPVDIKQAMERGDSQYVIDKLTLKQKAFVEEYMVDMVAAKAVLRAGYNTKNTTQVANGLLSNPMVRYSIDALRAQRREHSSVTSDFVLNKIVQTIARCENPDEGAKYDPNAILRGCELLARHLGLLRDRQEISGPDGGPIETQATQMAADDFKVAISRLAKRAETE